MSVNYSKPPKVSKETEQLLFQAIVQDDAVRIGVFLEQGISMSHYFEDDWDGICDDQGRRTFHRSISEVVVRRNALRIAGEFFKQGYSEAHFEREAPVAYAASFGSAEMIRLMIDKGFDPNKKRHSEPPLLIAVIRGSYECCAALIESGKCNPYVKDQYGRSYISDETDEQGHPIVISRDNRPLGEAARQGRLDIVQLIVEFKADKKTMVRAAVLAAENGHEDVSLYLLDKLDALRKKGTTHDYPYHIAIAAVQHRLTSVIDRIIAQEPRALHLVNGNSTLLSAACKHNDVELVRRLLAAGVDAHAQGDSIYYVYTGKEFLTCQSDELWERRYDPAPGMGDMKIAGPLRSQSPSSPLAEAAASGNLEIVRLLVEQGVDHNTAYVKTSRPNLKMSLMFNVAAIELAKHFGHNAVVDYLSSI